MNYVKFATSKKIGYEKPYDFKFWLAAVMLLVSLILTIRKIYKRTLHLSKNDDYYLMAFPVLAIIISLASLIFISPTVLSKFDDQWYKISNYVLFIVNLILMIIFLPGMNNVIEYIGIIGVIFITILYIVVIYLQKHNQANNINYIFFMSNILIFLFFCLIRYLFTLCCFL